MERLARTGRLRLRRTEGEDDPPTVRWDDGQPWRFALDVRSESGGKRWAWRGTLRRGDGRMDLSEPLVLLPGLLVLGVGRAARFDDLGVMPWILRLRYEKEITFVEPQQDLMLGRILAETRVPPPGAGGDAQPGGDQRQAAALPDAADPAPELGPGLRQADRRAGVRLRRCGDSGRADHAAGGLDRAGAGDPPRPADRERRRRQALRAGLPRGEGPAAGPGHARAAGQADARR